MLCRIQVNVKIYYSVYISEIIQTPPQKNGTSFPIRGSKGTAQLKNHTLEAQFPQHFNQKPNPQQLFEIVTFKIVSAVNPIS